MISHIERTVPEFTNTRKTLNILHLRKNPQQKPFRNCIQILQGGEFFHTESGDRRSTIFFLHPFHPRFATGSRKATTGLRLYHIKTRHILHHTDYQYLSSLKHKKKLPRLCRIASLNTSEEFISGSSVLQFHPLR